MTKVLATRSLVFTTPVKVLLASATLVLCAYIFRVPLVKAVASQYFNEGTQISCLDFQLGWSPVLTLDFLCLQSGNIELVVKDATLEDLNLNRKNQFFAKTATLHHKPSDFEPADDEPSNMTFALPASLPRLSIDRLTIDSYLIEQPLLLSVELNDSNVIHVSGAVDAELEIGNHMVTAKTSWKPADLLPFNHQLGQQVSDIAEQWQASNLLHAEIESDIKFDGTTLYSSHRVNWHSQLKIERCGVDFSAQGMMIVEADLHARSMNIDVNSLPLILSLKDCSRTLPQPIGKQIQQAKVIISKPVKLNQQGLSIDNIALTVLPFSDTSTIQMNSIQASFDGKVDAQVKINQQVNLADMQTARQAYQGNINVELTAELSHAEDQTRFTTKQASVVLEGFAIDDIALQRAQAKFDIMASLSAQGDWFLEQDGKVQLFNLSLPSDITIAEYFADINVNAQTQNATLELTGNSSAFEVFNVNVSKLSNQVVAQWNIDKGLQINGTSKLLEPRYQNYGVKEVKIDHQATNQFAQSGWFGNHQFSLTNGVSGYVFHQAQDIRLTIPNQPITYLQKWASQLAPNITLVDGQIGLSAILNPPKDEIDGQFQITDASFRYDDYQVIKLSIDEPFKLDSAGLQLDSGKLVAEEINVGVPMTQVQGRLSINNTVAKIDSASASVVGGNFSIANFYLDGREQTANLRIDSMDLAKLGELHSQEGIEISGEVSGRLPVSFTSQVTTVEQGKLSNDGPGTLKITNNAGFDAIKSQEQRLSYLENVEFEKLSSEVSLAPDGWLDLQISLAGHNPDKNQAVVFNYGHKENIFVLLKALRVANSIQNTIEKRLKTAITQKGKTQ